MFKVLLNRFKIHRKWYSVLSDGIKLNLNSFLKENKIELNENTKNVLFINEQVQDKLHTELNLIGNNILNVCVTEYFITHFKNLSFNQVNIIIKEFIRIDNIINLTCLIGAIYKEHGIKKVRNFIEEYIIRKQVVNISSFLKSFNSIEDSQKLFDFELIYEYEELNGSFKCNIKNKKNEIISSSTNLSKNLARENASQKILNEYFVEYTEQETPIEKFN